MRTGVRIPMMPKGVEHGTADIRYRAEFKVRIPMMPKGVEHETGNVKQTERYRENSDDAERR